MKQIATAMLALGTMLAALPAAGADAICPPNPPVGSTVNGNLIVPPGATCFLNHVTVTGNVDVQPQAELNVGFDSALPQPSSTIDGNVYVGTGATLVASSGISLDLTLGGNIEANQCNTVLLGPVIIGGNVDIQNCTGAESGYETA